MNGLIFSDQNGMVLPFGPKMKFLPNYMRNGLGSDIGSPNI